MLCLRISWKPAATGISQRWFSTWNTLTGIARVAVFVGCWGSICVFIIIHICAHNYKFTRWFNDAYRSELLQKYGNNISLVDELIEEKKNTSPSGGSTRSFPTERIAGIANILWEFKKSRSTQFVEIILQIRFATNPGFIMAGVFIYMLKSGLCDI